MASFIPRFLSIAILSVAILIAGTMANSAVAQSGRRSTGAPQYRPANQGSATHGSATHVGSGSRDLPVAMRGFCAVCLVESKHWVRGNSEFRAAFDGKFYHFPDAKALQMFQAMPGKYAPVLGGDDVVEFANTGRRIPGQLDFGVRHNDRIFFLSSAQNKQVFTAQPKNYEDVDLAAGGRCMVCQVELNQSMPGRREVAVVRNGIRYLFAGADQRNKFLASPAKYESAANPNLAGSGTQQGSNTNRGSSTQGSGTVQ